jgi:hypothetical protein
MTGLTAHFLSVVASLPFYPFVRVRVFTLTFFSIFPPFSFLSFLRKSHVAHQQSQETPSSRRFTLEAKWWKSFGHL